MGAYFFLGVTFFTGLPLGGDGRGRGRFIFVLHAIDEELLGDGEQTVGRRVEGKGGGQTVAEEGEDDRHELHHRGLRRVHGGRGGRELHLVDHGDAEEQREDVERDRAEVEEGVRRGEIVRPKEGGVAEFGGAGEHGEETHEEWDREELGGDSR